MSVTLRDELQATVNKLLGGELPPTCVEAVVIDHLPLLLAAEETAADLDRLLALVKPRIENADKIDTGCDCDECALWRLVWAKPPLSPEVAAAFKLARDSIKSQQPETNSPTAELNNISEKLAALRKSLGLEPGGILEDVLAAMMTGSSPDEAAANGPLELVLNTQRNYLGLRKGSKMIAAFNPAQAQTLIESLQEALQKLDAKTAAPAPANQAG